MTTQTVRPSSLEKLRAMRNDPPREARVNQPDSQLEGLQLNLTALEDRLEAAITMGRIGEGLREARKRRKLSTRALADRLNISQTRVVNVERASETLELQTIARFAAQLGYRLAVQLIPEDANDPAMLIQLPTSRQAS